MIVLGVGESKDNACNPGEVHISTTRRRSKVDGCLGVGEVSSMIDCFGGEESKDNACIPVKYIF